MFDRSEKIKCCEIHKIQTESWEDIKNTVYKAINNCRSISRLKNSRFIFKSLTEHIRQSRLFFSCESNSINTQITVSLLDEKFMTFVVNERLTYVPEYMQEEISEMLESLCHSAIDCIDKRIRIVEERNKRLSKRDDFLLALFITIVFISFFVSIPDNINLYGTFSSVDELVMCFPWAMLAILRVLSMIAITVIPLRRFIREDF